MSLILLEIVKYLQQKKETVATANQLNFAELAEKTLITSVLACCLSPFVNLFEEFKVNEVPENPSSNFVFTVFNWFANYTRTIELDRFINNLQIAVIQYCRDKEMIERMK